ncbi:MAG: hypothetical protein M3011_12580, partial [Actinomycetota bacterium]|nr:hypothetical protein [Actinomycetota bacterium]
GAAVAVVGVDALRHVQRPKEVAIASLPLLLAAHQLTESFVWSDLHHRTPPVTTGGVAVSLYAVVAFVVVPAVVPWAVLAVEPVNDRRRLMAPFAVLGCLVAVAYAGAMGQRPVVAAIAGHHISYETGLRSGGTMAAVYVVAVCVPLFASSYPRIVAFGACNAVAVAVLIFLSQEELTSLWCAWAAVTSTVIAAHLRMINPSPLGVTRSSRFGAHGDRPRSTEREACT